MTKAPGHHPRHTTLTALLLLLGATIVWTWVGCGDQTSEEDADGSCDGGTRVVIDGVQMCVFQASDRGNNLITETGFRCPVNMPYEVGLYMLDASVVWVCSDIMSPDPGIPGDAVEEVLGQRPPSTVSPETPQQPGTPDNVSTNKVDILWVVDNSGSMCEEQASIREEANRFVQELADAGLDFQVAVITTDMEDPTQSGRF
ncbi:MAG: hypothetical protein AAFS10_17945, partial [Myxococcota bacterium]